MNKTPKLRFKEFSREWESKKLENLGQSIIGLTYSPDDVVDSGTLVLRSSNIKNNKIVYTDNVFVNMDIQEKIITKENDILICSRNGSRGLIGKSALIDKRSENKTFGAFMTIFRSDQGKFIFQLLQSQKFFKQIHQNLGATINQITSKDLNSMQFYVPSLEEQDKIADFFSLIDDKISLQSEKVEGLKDYKKGMIQKIFRRELRFKDDDGVDYPEWEEKSLGEVLTSRIEKQVPSQEAPLMSFTAKGGIEPKGDKYDRSFLVKSDEKLYKRTELNDFIYSSNNLDVGSIGLNRYGTAVISDVYEIFIISKDVSCNFISELLQTPKVMNKILRYRQGVMYGQYRIHADEFLKIKESMPCLEEQNKIENFISIIDDKINKEQEKLDYLNEYKKGLLQQMFI